MQRVVVRGLMGLSLCLLGCNVSSGLSVADGGATDMAGRPVSSAALLKACALVDSCGIWPRESAGAQCINDLEGSLKSYYGSWFGSAVDVRRLIDCAQSASDCTGVLKCMSGNRGPDFCMYTLGRVCVGDVQTSCSDGWAILTIDCAALGEHCHGGVTDWTANCTNGVVCEPGKPQTCDGNRLVTCNADSHLQSSVDCASWHAGSTCGVFRSFANCLPAGPICNDVGPAPLRCESNTLIECVWGHEVATDCAAFEGHCTTDGGWAHCVNNATACTITSPDQCSGTSLRICVNGHFESIDCTSIGFRTCAVTDAVFRPDLGTTPATAKCIP